MGNTEPAGVCPFTQTSDKHCEKGLFSFDEIILGASPELWPLTTQARCETIRLVNYREVSSWREDWASLFSYEKCLPVPGPGCRWEGNVVSGAPLSAVPLKKARCPVFLIFLSCEW